ncbi:nuclear transport factor 2 family protein [Nonomuraea sp. NPDC048916]|uniref:YybH family protein n=1 Tax=Nonomuraea sp. NPDC048916 TaxID=3154232 RepID=UPI003408EAAD
MSKTAEKEIRDHFEEWFRDAAAKDLDAVMTKIADDAVSYEHDAPLVCTGAPAIREVCRQGFDVMAGELRWDIPDLHVIVRDDLAVSWGLNRMRAQEPGKEPVELWSRGTRVFQRIDGEWKMIHQHVSYPLDPETGRAATDLRPDR